MAENYSGSVIGPNLRRLRSKSGLSQNELAHKTGVSIATIKNLERGANVNPEMSTLESLVAAFKAPVAELFRPVRKPA